MFRTESAYSYAGPLPAIFASSSMAHCKHMPPPRPRYPLEQRLEQVEKVVGPSGMFRQIERNAFLISYSVLMLLLSLLRLLILFSRLQWSPFQA
jgi:hypothetical protein